MHFLLLFYFIVWIFLLVPTLNMKKNASKLSNNLLQRPTPKRPPCVQPSSLNLSLLLSTKKVWCVLNFTESRHSMLGKEGLLCTRLYREPRFIGVYFINLWKNSCMVVVGPVAHDTKIFSLIALIYLCFFSHSMHTHAHKDLKPPHSTSSSSPTVGSRRRSTPRPSFLSSSHPCASPWGDHCDHQLQSAYCRNGQGLGEGGFSEMVKA